MTTRSTNCITRVVLAWLCCLVVPLTTAETCQCQTSSFADSVTTWMDKNATTVESLSAICESDKTNKTNMEPWTGSIEMTYRYCETLSESQVLEDSNCHMNTFCQNADDLSCTRDGQCNALFRTSNIRCTNYATETLQHGGVTPFLVGLTDASTNDNNNQDLSCGTFTNQKGQQEALCGDGLIHQDSFRSIPVFVASGKVCFGYNASLGAPCDGSCVDVDATAHLLPVAAHYNAWVELTLVSQDVCECRDEAFFITDVTTLEPLVCDQTTDELWQDFYRDTPAVTSLRTGNAEDAVWVETSPPDHLNMTFRYCERPASSRVYYDVDCHENDLCVNANSVSCTRDRMCHEIVKQPEVCTEYDTQPLDTVRVLVGRSGSNNQAATLLLDSDDLSCGEYFLPETQQMAPLCAATNVVTPHFVRSYYVVSSDMEGEVCIPFDAFEADDSSCRARCFRVDDSSNHVLSIVQHAWFDAWVEFSFELPVDTPPAFGQSSYLRIVLVAGCICAFLVLATVIAVMHGYRKRATMNEEIAKATVADDSDELP